MKIWYFTRGKGRNVSIVSSNFGISIYCHKVDLGLAVINIQCMLVYLLCSGKFKKNSSH